MYYIGCQCKINKVHTVVICLVVCLFLVSSSGTDDKSNELLCHTHFTSLDPNTYYISLTPGTNYSAKDQRSESFNPLNLNYTILLLKSKMQS